MLSVLKLKDKCNMCKDKLYLNSTNKVFDIDKKRIIKVCNCCMNAINSRNY